MKKLTTTINAAYRILDGIEIEPRKKIHFLGYINKKSFLTYLNIIKPVFFFKKFNCNFFLLI